jgi:hypothetical protein
MSRRATPPTQSHDATSRRYDDQGLPVLCLPRGGMLCVGQTLHWFKSPRSGLSPAAREVLLPAFTEAVRAREPVQRHRMFDRHQWTVRAEPIVCPRTNHVVAVQGSYIPQGRAEWPAPIRVGAWAVWPTPYGPQHITPSYPSDELLSLYGLDPTEADLDLDESGHPYWHAPKIRRDIVHPDDRWTLMAVFDQLISATHNAPITCTFRIRPENPRWVRTIGWKEGPWLNGIVHEIRDPSQIPNQPADGLRNLGSSLPRAFPIAAIEPFDGYIAMSNDQFQALVSLPPNNQTSGMIHPDDQERFTAACRSVAQGEAPQSLRSVRFWSPDGQWHALSARLWDLPMQTGEHPSSYVACEVWAPG